MAVLVCCGWWGLVCVLVWGSLGVVLGVVAGFLGVFAGFGPVRGRLVLV